MTVGDVGRLRVRADLRLVVDGGDDTEPVDACIVGDGTRLTMSSRDVPALFARAVAASSASGLGSVRQSTRQVGALLDDAGLSLEVVGGRGTVVEIGADCRSRAGRLLLGTDFVRLGSARSLAPVLSTYVRASPLFRTGLRLAVLGGVAAAGLAATRRPRR